MSVVIHRLPMPVCCSDCSFCKYEQYALRLWFCTITCNLLNGDDYSVARPNDCPLTELPDKHGRLIDADEMKELWKGCTFEGDITCLLDVRPTVLEAEG